MPAAALNEAAGFLRNSLFKRLSIHTVPTLHFQFDKHYRACGRAERRSSSSANATRARRTASEPTARARSQATRARGADHEARRARRAACSTSRSAWTSNDALAEGQAPATGLRRPATPARSTRWPAACLPLTFGAGTKFSQVSLDADKTYRATLQPRRAYQHRRPPKARSLESNVPVDGRRSPPSRPRSETFHRPDRAGAADALGAQARRSARSTNMRAPASPIERANAPCDHPCHSR